MIASIRSWRSSRASISAYSPPCSTASTRAASSATWVARSWYAPVSTFMSAPPSDRGGQRVVLLGGVKVGLVVLAQFRRVVGARLTGQAGPVAPVLAGDGQAVE